MTQWYHLSGAIVAETVGPDWPSRTVVKCRTEEEAQAISALPNLLAALEIGLNLWPGAADGSRPVHPDVRHFVNAARAAISKAQGKAVVHA